MIETLPIEKLKPAFDVRDPGDVSDLVASIRSIGLLQPLVVAPSGNGAYDVIAGRRRLAAAKLAELTELACVVRDDLDDTTRLEAALVENLRRKDMTPLEEAQGYQGLVELGLSQRAVATKVGCGQSHVSKRLALLALPEGAHDRLAAGDITIDDALELTKLAEHPKRQADVLRKAASKDPWNRAPVGTYVRGHVAELEGLARRDKVTAELKAKGVKVIKAPTYWYGWKGGRRIAPNDLDVDVKAHASEKCHAVAVDDQGEATPVCVRPANHPKARKDGRGPLRDKDKAERARRRDHTKARRDADFSRFEFMRDLLGRRLGAGEVLERVVLAWICQRATSTTALRTAATLAGLEVTGGARGQVPDYRHALIEFIKAGPKQVARAALAIAFAAGEEPVAGDWPQWREPVVAQHIAFLEAHGYVVSSAERLELAGGAPR